MSITRTIDEKDIQVGVGLIIRKLRELNRESHASEPAMSQERAAEVYKKISSILKNMAETSIPTRGRLNSFSSSTTSLKRRHDLLKRTKKLVRFLCICPFWGHVLLLKLSNFLSKAFTCVKH